MEESLVTSYYKSRLFLGTNSYVTKFENIFCIATLRHCGS